MKKAVFSIALVALTAACLPLTSTPQPGPVVDAAGTAEALLKTAVAATMTALPTKTSTIPVNSATPSQSPKVSSTPPATETPTMFVEPTITFTAVTGTIENVTITAIAATIDMSPASITQTPGVLTYGTLPPAVPFSSVTLVNKAKTQAYISLQVVTAEGGPTIMEYPVRRKIEIDAPVGNYLYVAWIGGRKMVGEFRLHHDEDLEIILYRDKVVVQ